MFDKEDTIELTAPIVPAPPEPRPFTGRRTYLGWSLPDIAGAAILALCVFVVHDVGYMLTHTFFFDEAWVALSTRAPLGSLPWMTSSTPLGWTFLLRLVPAGGEALRVVPLVFTVAAVAAAWWFGRELPLPRFTAFLTGLAVLLVPAMLVRDDLKQYTAETFAAIVVLALVARLEAQWSRRRLAAIVIFTPAAMLFANAVVFVGLAAIVAIAVEPLVRRDWRRLGEVAVGGLATVGLGAAVYAAVDARNATPSLTVFWRLAYVPRNQGVHGAVTFVHDKAAGLAPYLGLKSFGLEIAMMIIGIVVLVRVRRYAVAMIVPLTILLVIAASADRKYPFGDLRTSTFWLVMVAVLMAVGAAGLLDILRRRTSSLVAVVALAAIVAAWVAGTHSYIRGHPLLNNENMRSLVHYVDSHRQPDDIVIVDWGAAYGFGYYEHSAKLSYEKRAGISTTGFIPAYPHVPWLVQIPRSQPAEIPVAFADAAGRLSAANGRVWIVRSYVETPSQEAAWSRTLAGRHVRTILGNAEWLELYEPSAIRLRPDARHAPHGVLQPAAPLQRRDHAFVPRPRP